MNINKLWIGIILGLGIVLQIHNSLIYNYPHGFDGKGHVEYLEYIRSEHKLPLPHQGWQFYQTPLYYLLAMPTYVLGGVKAVQLQNIIYYLAYLYLTGYLVQKIFSKEKNSQVIATLALAALPIANYLVPMVSNEFLNDLVMGVALLWMMMAPTSIGIIILLAAGFYTKYTVLTLGPAYAIALWQTKDKVWKRYLAYGALFALLISPIVLRNIYHYKTPLAMAESFFPFPPGREARDLSFFTNLSWIPKADLFQSQHYSFIGGTWSTFWHDGYQATVPVVPFHKKAYGLWLLGFPLSLLSILGWVKIKKNNTKVFKVGMTYLVTAVLAYILYNFHLPYPSELKSFFMSGLPIIYVLGITSSYSYIPKSRKLITVLLIIQFALMIAYFWIMPWWHVV